jgi:hypothetical protein
VTQGREVGRVRAPRRPPVPMALQEVLFPYLDAL